MTPNKEDYLKTIYEIGQEADKITNKEIAQQMTVSPPAVTEMTKRMIAEGLIEKNPQKGYHITPQGQELVADLYRKHRLIETFLIRSLHYSLDQVHEEAEVLEHTVSTHFIDQLEILLDYPKYCPHGGSIPAKGQLLTEEHQQSLADSDQPGSYQLMRVKDRLDILHYIEEIGLSIGDSFTLSPKNATESFSKITYQDQLQLVPDAMAEALYVVKC